jgi:Dyp-type peroxidase family
VSTRIERDGRIARMNKIKAELRKQPGIEFPAPRDQPHILIIRINLSRHVDFGHNSPDNDQVRKGLKRICGLFERIWKGEKTIDEFGQDGMLRRKNLVDDYGFSATVGFGLGFFDRLSISDEKRPRHLREMPDHVGLGDVSPYSLTQTDLLIQIASKSDHINRWVLENTLQAPLQNDIGEEQDIKKDCPEGIDLKPNQRCCPDGQILELGQKCTPDITSALEGWATVEDVHAGFQRLDGRNLLGFNDGVSNPSPGTGAYFDNVVWVTKQDEGEVLKDGTYLVYQKIEHDLDQWRQLSLAQQEDWVGRKKITGLLKGTLTDEQDKKLAQNLQSPNQRVREQAEKCLKELTKQQRDPTYRFYDEDRFKKAVPVWSHVRKANPREELIDIAKGSKNGRIGSHLIFRRGFLFVENDENDDVRSGLHFICFQRNIDEGFEFIKRNWLNNKNFPTPFPAPGLKRTFTQQELDSRRRRGRFTGDELIRIRYDLGKRRLIGLEAEKDFNQALHDAGFNSKRYREDSTRDRSSGIPITVDTQNTGREGLAGPSELGVNPTGQFLAISPMGGGYYFVPPIPKKSIKDIGQQFFE